MAKKWRLALQVAATYVGTVVGAGFATGREVVEFFTQFGWYGVIGISLSSILFIWLGTKIMIISSRTRAYSYHDLIDHLAGKKLGRWINFFILFILLGVTSVMLSGTGAIFEEQLGLPYHLGILLTMVFCYLVMSRGLKGIMLVNSLVVPMMAFFSILLAGEAFSNMNGFSQHLESASIIVSSDWRWVFRAITYACLNVTLAQAVLVPLGREVRDEGVLKLGGWIGGAGLLVMLLCTNFALLTLPNVATFDIPMGEVVKHFGFFLHYMFLFIIYGEIFTTLIGNIYGLARHIHVFSHLAEKTLFIFILLFCFLVSPFGFSSLLSALYPIFGYFCFFFVLLLAFRRSSNIGR